MFLRCQGLLLIVQPLQGELALAPGIEQVIATLPGLFQGGVGRLQVLLELLPNSGIVVAVAAQFRLVQPLEFVDQWLELRDDGLEPLPLFGLIRLQASEPLRSLTMPSTRGPWLRWAALRSATRAA